MATLFCQRTSCIRSLNSASRTFTVPASVRASFHSTTIAPQPRPSRITSQLNTLRPVSGLPVLLKTTLSRPASTSSTTSSSQTTIPDDALTWNRFFDLRRKRRWVNLGASVVTAVASVGVIAPMLAEQDFDTWGAQISGIDPIFVLGISTFAIAAAGWLCGPAFGNTMFSVWAGRRGWSKLIAEKEKSFYARIKRYRADPSATSPQNPIPDYYGEKISSVKDYRRWLKDQRAFNLKKSKNMI